jgi:hypothetical protein
VEILDRVENVRSAWTLAFTKGYCRDALIDYTAPDFANFAVALIPGLLAALLIPIAGQIGGGLAGTGLGMIVTAATGQAEVIPILANAGRALGLLVADVALVYMGVIFIKDFIVPRIGGVGEHIGKGCWIAYYAPPHSGERLVDQAAKEMADGFGLLMGLVLMGILRYLTKGPTDRIARLNASLLAKTCPRLIDWVARNSRWLEERYKNGPTKIPGGGQPPPPVDIPAPVAAQTISIFEPKVIEGGVAAGTRTAMQSAIETAKAILPYLVSRIDRQVSPRDLADLDGWLKDFGFYLIRAEPYGPDQGVTGWQLFWQKGNVLVRFKTTGENGGPRQGIPHLSPGYNDGRGLDWQNDLAKFTWNGRIVAKCITDPAKFKATDFQGNPQKFVLLPTNFDISAVDAWAAQTHLM